MSIKTGLEYIGAIDPWTDEERLSDEEIVRCRDCCCRHTVDSHELCIRFNHATNHDGFCAWAQRREVDA